MKVKIFTVLLLLIMLVLVFPLIANADRCIIIPRDDIVLSEPGQKAFIAHNGQMEDRGWKLEVRGLVENGKSRV